ncbi:IS5 family transposase [Ancylobacter sp. IITR112]|uniref:IS5 family transposase n=1 Tax=Ancylobacter sp. IITR112 TaxID=3138073 RepID=UPI00352B7375
MSRRNLSQPSLADALVSHHSRGNKFLEDVAKLIDWSAFAVLFKDIHGNALGAPGFPPIAMFKIALLKQWYGLSDPAAEEAVADRLSFRRFCGFPLDQKTPDHMSIWRFRQRLVELGLQDTLLAELNRQLEGRGLLVKRGTLVDATIISAAVAKPDYDKGQVSERDPDAGFTHKHGKTYFGYKAHLAGDGESGLIRQAQMSSADLHDSQMAAALIQGDEDAYYADKAYDSQALRDELTERGIKDRIAYKARRGKRQPNWQKWMNKVAASVRAGIERTNATMKNWYGMARVRYLGLVRNHCHLQLVACAMNAKRALVLIKAGAA